MTDEEMAAYMEQAHAEARNRMTMLTYSIIWFFVVLVVVVVVLV